MKIVGALAAATVVATVGATDARAAAACREAKEARIWTSPETPVVGQPLRVLAVGEGKDAPGEAQLSITVGTGAKDREALPTTRRDGPPPSFAATIPTRRAGAHRIELVRAGKVVSCREISVVAPGKRRPRAQPAGFWATTRAWDAGAEALYAAWIEALFDAPADASVSFPSLAPVIRDPGRNFLWGHLGLAEDDEKQKGVPRAEPDCADLPYYLRAYFSWKMGLPFAFRDCDRGNGDRPPRCSARTDNETPIALALAPKDGKPLPKALAATLAKPVSDPLTAWKLFLRQLTNKVHSGSVRTALADDETDFYPVSLSREALRPGTIYADPYGHVLMLVKWVPQADGRGGRLLAVDGQPDNSVGRKRFWEGTFLFANGVKSAGPGWKAFRPVVRQQAETKPLPNDALAEAAPFAAPFSVEQGKLPPEAFYARMAGLINPQGLPATTAYEETLAAVLEQMETRIGSVDNGEKFMRENGNPLVPMPEGAKIFETVGPWEDYATPSRDMRLIIALNVLLGLPERIARHPELFVLGGKKPAEVRAEIEALHARRIKEKGIEYKRSDGSPFRLTVADVIARKTALEVAYNPNDCVEVRWGASEGTPDHATCKRRAPADQQARMNEHRAWFREARRPSR